MVVYTCISALTRLRQEDCSFEAGPGVHKEILSLKHIKERGNRADMLGCGKGYH